MMLQDLRFAIRAFLSAPAFTFAAVLSLAIGVGANTAIFSVTSALLLRPLPYRDPDRLVILWSRSPGLGITEDWFSTAQYFDIKASGAFDRVAIAIGGNYNLSDGGEPERIGTIRMSSNLLPMLGVGPQVGRVFLAADDSEGAPGVALLAHATWMRRYGGDPHVIGRSITLNGQPYQVVGVLPATFRLPREVMPTLGGAENADIVLPLPLGPKAAEIRAREDYNIIATLKTSSSARQAQAEMDGLTARLRRDHPDFYPPGGGLTFSVVPLQEQVVGDVRRSVIVLTAAVGCVLLIACANVANLLLSRALGRQKEIAVRAALGASRARLVQQLLSESMLLAIGGGLLGLLLAYWSVQGIHALGAGSVPRLHEIGIDVPVLLFTLVISAASGLVFGLAPATRLGRVDVHGSLKEAARGSTGSGAVWGGRQRLRGLLVVAELALAVMLLIAAALLIRSFMRVQRVPPGFNPRGIMTFELTMTGRKYADGQRVLDTYRQLWDQLKSLPSVESAGGVSALPLSQMMAWGPVVVEGRAPVPGEKFINVDQRVAGGDYFRVMEIPLIAGRVFTDRDTRNVSRGIVIDRRMAEQLWPAQDPIGKRVRTGGIDANPNAPWMTVIGVVGSVKQDALDADSRMAMYFAHTQSPTRAMNVVVRTTLDPNGLTASIRDQIRQIDPDLPVYNVRSMAERVDASLARRRFSMLLLALFAAVALVLAVIGVYGVMAYVVSQGTRELGIRIALGATPAQIVIMIVQHSAAVALVGVAIGLAGAFGATRFMRTLLFGVHPWDPITFAAIPALLVLVAVAASLIPAGRAASVDPILSLHSE